MNGLLHMSNKIRTVLLVVLGTFISGVVLYFIAYMFTDTGSTSLFIVIGDTTKELLIALISYFCGKYGFRRIMRLGRK